MQVYSLRELHYLILPFHFFRLKREFARSHCFVHGSPDLFSIRKSLAPYMGFFP